MRKKIIIIVATAACILASFFVSAATIAESQDTGASSAINIFSDFGKYLADMLAPGEIQQLPLGISKKIGSATFDILITRASVKADYIDADIFLRVTAGGQRYFFGTDSVKLSANGLFFVEEVRLGLLSEQEFSLKGGVMKVKLKGDKYGNNLPQTYVVFDCNGFKEISLAGSVEFSNSIIAPVNFGKLFPKGKVIASFDGYAASFDDLLLTIHIPEFEITGFPDWRFQAGTAILDLSTQRNAEAMKTYTATREYLPKDEEEENLWTGVFLSDLTVTFPSYIKGKDSKPPVITSENFWIDEYGVTGVATALNILDKDLGQIGEGWGISIDKFELAFVRNKIIRGTMEGVISLPISKNNTFNYSTTFYENGKWMLKVHPDEKMKFDMFNADDVMISKTSYISVIKYPDADFPELTACLSGKMQINPFKDNVRNFNLGTIEFSSFKITNKEGEPPVSIGKLKFDKEIKFGGFPASIDDITFSYTKKEIFLSLDVTVRFTSETAGAFKGSSTLKIYALPTDSGYRYNSTELTDIAIDFSNAAFAFKGSVKHYRGHYIYGDGFDGDIDLSIVPLNNMGVKAKMMFGRVYDDDLADSLFAKGLANSMASAISAAGGYSYWYVDFLARFGENGFPVFPGFKCSGIGGGAYYQMGLESNYQGNKYGEELTETGLRYYPDSSQGAGGKLSLEISTAGSDIFKGLASVDIGFNNHSGLDHVTLQVNASFLPPSSGFAEGLGSWVERVAEAVQPENAAKRKKRSVSSAKSSIAAVGVLSYVFPEKAFYGSLEAYLNMGLLRGAGSEGLAGKMNMYFGPDMWHIKVGEPKHPLALKLKSGKMEAQAAVYFMTGNNLPSMPAMPNNISRLLTNEPSLPARDISSLTKGCGVAFGGKFSVSTDRMNLVGAYAELDFDAGFDLMMKNYGDTLVCGDFGDIQVADDDVRTSSNDVLSSAGGLQPVGINGWYATGQTYAYLFGDVGLQLNVFGKKKSFSLGQIETAATLKAALPNPSYVEGSFGLNYSVLNGLVRGYHVFEFDLGDKCEIR
ncbi:MAG: hypothetical protein LBR45_05275 [Bacteroidales bacterium]|jgi:hypothetical protein|nr:hypothetical protein [Bacteroidales bacterium]